MTTVRRLGLGALAAAAVLATGRVEALTNLDPLLLDEAEGGWYPLTQQNVNAILSGRP